MKGADLIQTNLSKAYLYGVDLTGSNLDRTNLTGAYLWKATLSINDVKKTTMLQGADISGANIQRTKIPGTSQIYIAQSSACINSGTDIGAETSKWMPSLPSDNKAQQVVGQVDEPSFDGHALQISNPGGGQFTNIAASYPLLQTSTGQTLRLSLCFYLPDLTRVQVLTFSVNRWSGNQRYEMSLQYEAIGDGTLQQGTPPTWRIWTGKDDQLTKAGQQPLSEGRWHWLDFQGETDNKLKLITYTSFTLDGKTYSLNQSFPAVSFPSADSLNIAVQLGGDAKGDPYSIYLDDINFNR